MSNIITVAVSINADINTVWEYFTNPIHVVGWNYASDDWECSKASSELKVKGRFCYTMEAKDKTVSFDFSGVYDLIDSQKLLKFTLCEVGVEPIDGDRKVTVEFEKNDEITIVTESFDPESVNAQELQKQGWQAILNNFKKYVENHI